MSRPEISVVIPAYNEERGIAEAVSEVRARLEAGGCPYEILVVDNASEDGTVERLRPLLEGTRVRLLENDSNRGKGHSVRRGMLAASGRLRLHCDADCASSMASLPAMIDLLEDADVVAGSRLAPGARVGRRQPLRRRIPGRAFVELCRLVLGERTRDLFCGFKLWRAEAAVAAYSRARLDGWVFDAEALALAHALGYRVRESGIAWDDREGSRLSLPRVLVPAIRDLLRARRHVRRELAAEGRARGLLRARRTLRLDRFELAALAALAALSVAVVAGLLLRVWLRGGLVTGSDGFLVADQLQYLNWLRQAGGQLAVENLYDLAPGPASFVHPGVAISGLLHRAGVGLAASYMAWKPVAVVALFAAALLYTRRFLDRAGDRRLALALALFTASPVSAAVGWSGLGGETRKLDFDFIGGELWPGTYLWGYLFTAMAVALVPLGLLAYERGRAGGSPALLGWAAAAGLACSWLQPWQGATFALVLGGAELLSRLRGGRSAGAAARDLALPVAATAAPLVYYLVLSRADASWALADRANDLPRWPWWVTAIALAPLALPALLAYRLPAPGFGALALRVWPAAALLVFHQPAGTFPFHALQGLTLPLVVLGVLALRDRLGERPLPALPAVLAALVLIVPGTAYRVDEMRDAVNRGLQPHFLTADEHDALAYLDRLPEKGGVLAPVYSGLLIPAYTGRETWVGAGSWTPDFDARLRLAERLFAGRLGTAEAERAVRGSGARFLFSDCHGRADIEPLVARFAGPPVRFGCAAVYRVRG